MVGMRITSISVVRTTSAPSSVERKWTNVRRDRSGIHIDFDVTIPSTFPRHVSAFTSACFISPYFASGGYRHHNNASRLGTSFNYVSRRHKYLRFSSFPRSPSLLFNSSHTGLFLLVHSLTHCVVYVSFLSEIIKNKVSHTDEQHVDFVREYDRW